MDAIVKKIGRKNNCELHLKAPSNNMYLECHVLNVLFFYIFRHYSNCLSVKVLLGSVSFLFPVKNHHGQVV